MKTADMRWTLAAHEGTAGLVRLEADWRRLVAEMPEAGPQHQYETHLAYCRRLSPAGADYTCLALTDGERVRAIFPLERGTIRLGGREFSVLGLPWQMLDLCPDLVCPADEAQVRLFPAVLDWMRRARGGPKWLVLDRILADSAASRCLRGLAASRLCIAPRGASVVFDCELEAGRFEARLAPQFRTNLRTATRRLAGMGQIRFVNVTDPDGVQREFKNFLEVESSGWKGLSGASGTVRSKPQQQAFYQDLVDLSAQGSGCEFNALYLGHECIATQLCLRCGSELAIPKLGYDERFARGSPGQLLLGWILQRCRADPRTKRVNMVSNADWFRPWRPDHVPNLRVFIGVGRWSGPVLASLLRWARSWKQAISGTRDAPAALSVRS